MTEYSAPILQSTRRQVEASSDPVSGSLVAVLLRGWRVIVTCTLAAVLVGAIYAYRIATPVYRTHALVMINAQDTEIIGVENVLSALSRDAQVLNSQVEVLRSRGLIDIVVRELALNEDPEFNPTLSSRTGLRSQMRSAAEGLGLIRPVADPFLSPQAAQTATVNSLIRKLDITVEPETLVISLAIGTREAAKSAAIVNLLAETYVTAQVLRKQDATDLASDWLAERVASLETALGVAEARSDAWRAENGDITESRLDDLERQLAARRSQQAPTSEILALQDDIETMSMRLAEGRQLVRDADVMRAQVRLFRSRLEETSLLDGSLTPDAQIVSPAVIPLYPASPKPTLILGLALIAGLGLGVIGVLAMAELRPRYLSAAAMEEDLGIPVLAALPLRDIRGEKAAIGQLARRLDGLEGGVAMVATAGLGASARWLRNEMVAEADIAIDLERDWPLAAGPPGLTLVVLSQSCGVAEARRLVKHARIARPRRLGIVLLAPGRYIPQVWAVQGV